jgi:filamentous hemagglutinin
MAGPVAALDKARKAATLARGLQETAQAEEAAAIAQQTAKASEVTESAVASGREPIAVRKSLDLQDAEKALNDPIHEVMRGGAGRTPTPSSGAAAAAKGLAREEAVADLVGGAVSRQKLTVKGLGSTDLDVLGKAGEYIGVGGPAKAGDLSRFGRQLQILKKAAEEKGVPAIMYLEEGTPEAAISLAKKWLGESSVKIFKP